MKLRFYLVYIVLVAVQILLGNYLNLGQYVLLCFLPSMLLFLPINVGTVAAMLIAFVTGFFVDFFTHGILGLTICALLPVAFCREWIIRLVFGNEVFSRGEDVNIERQGIAKVSLASLIATALFFLIYIWVDGAGTRPMNFNIIRFVLSCVVSMLVSLYVIHILTSEEVRRWR